MPSKKPPADARTATPTDAKRRRKRQLMRQRLTLGAAVSLAVALLYHTGVFDRFEHLTQNLRHTVPPIAGRAPTW